MSLSAILSLTSGIKGLYDAQQAQQLAKKQQASLRGQLSEAERAAQSTLSSLRDDPRFKVQQAPTRSADTAMNLAQQSIDSARDRALGGLSSLTIGSDPRFAGANVQRAIRAYDQGINTAEQQGAAAVTAGQKAIDDASYAASEMERKRQEALKQFELQQAVTGIQQAGEGLSQFKAYEISQKGQNAQDFLGLAGNLANLKRGPETVNNYYQTLPRTENTVDTVDTENTLRNVSDPNGGDYVGGLLATLNQYDPYTIEEQQSIEMDNNPFDPTQNDNPLDPTQDVNGYGPLRMEGAGGERSPVDIRTGDSGYSGNDYFRDDDFQVYGTNVNSLLRQLNLTPNYAKGGYFSADEGGITQGEFNHDTNKKAVIDEETGEKEAELTGGEGVFSADDLGDIVAFVKEGDEDGLFSFLKAKLQEPQFGYEFA